VEWINSYRNIFNELIKKKKKKTKKNIKRIKKKKKKKNMINMIKVVLQYYIYKWFIHKEIVNIWKNENM